MVSAIFYGLRVSLYVGVVSGVIALTLGAVLGVHAAYAGGLYDWHVRTPRSSLALRILFSALIAGAATVAFFYVLFFQPVGRYVMGIGVGLSVPFILTPRYLLWRLLRGRPRHAHVAPLL